VFQLLATETVEVGIKRVLAELLAESEAWLLNPGEMPDKAVHNARKHGKRLRAVWRLVRGSVPVGLYRQENEVVREASRRLGGMRDTAVLIETLDRLISQAQQPPESFATVRAQLVADYEQTCDAFWADPTVIPEVVGVWREVHGRVQTLQLPYNDFRTLADGLQKVYQDGQNHMRLAYQTNNFHDFHEWRKQVKYLWHQLELLQGGWPLVIEAIANELHDLSGYLGDAHDLAVLIETIQQQPQKYADPVTLAHLTLLAERQMHQLEAAAYPLGRRLYAESPRSFTQRLGNYWQVWRETGYNGYYPPPDNAIENVN
jgi:CHAD domain-containing protein